MNDFIGFALCALIIFFAGKKLSFYGDLIAAKTGLGKAWIGLILMASVTSLPEMVVGISASSIIQSADLAVGDILGSCTFNLAILAMLDVFVPKHQYLFFVASSRHVLSATLGIILVALAGLGLFLPGQFIIIPGIGLISAVFVVIYFLSVRLIYQFELKRKIEEKENEANDEKTLSLQKVITLYSVFAVIIVFAALFIPYFSNGIAEKTGLSKSFVGTVFMAVSTSLPEIAVSIAAVRMGSIDLAVGNLLGSNIFNILILAVDDIFYTKGVLLKDASDSNLVSVFAAVIMTAIAIAGFTYKAETKRFLIAPDASLILFFYILNLFLLYQLSN